MLSILTLLFKKTFVDVEEEKVEEEKVEEEKAEEGNMVEIGQEREREKVEATNFSCTMMVGNIRTAFARRTFTEEPKPLDVGNPCETLFVLDSHSKAIDMSAVEAFLGGRVYHGQGPALQYSKRGGHERRSYCSSSR